MSGQGTTSPGFIIVDRNAEVITILDNDSPDQPPPLGRGTIRFEFANYVVVEGQPFIEARVIREGGQLGVIQGEVSIQFATAIEPDISDPTQVSIFFGDQDITPKIIRIPIVDDNIPESTEQFTLVLTERRTGTGQDVSGANNLVVDRSVVQIIDNDGSNSTFPTITLAQSIINVPENAGFVEVPIDVVFPPGGRPAPGDSVYTVAAVSGTAAEGQDFTVFSRTFNFGGANQSFREVLRIPITNDTLSEGLESFSVRITTSTGAFLGNATSIVNIIDDDVSATVQIEPVTPNEGNTVTIKVVPVGVFEPGEIRTVTIKTQDVTAKLGEDFTAPNFSNLTFTFDSPSPQTATLRVIPDQINEQDETFQIITTGTRTVNGVTLPLVISGGTQTITIRETEGLRISSVTPIVTEGLDRFAQVKVERLGDTSIAIVSTISVQGTGENGALADRDFTPVSEVVRFGAGDGTPKIINIPIIDNGIIQNARSFLVTLTGARTDRPEFPPIREVITNVGSANPVIIERPDPRNQPNVPIPVSGGPVTITILDNDGPNAAAGTAAARGSLQFEKASYVVDEGQGFVDIRVQRVGGTSGAVNAELKVATGDVRGAAKIGEDFLSPAQTSIFFADGVGGFQTIRIPIINDTIAEVTESFALNLTEKRGDQTLVVNSTIVQITDNDGDQVKNFGTVGFGDLRVLNVSEGAGLIIVPVQFSGAVTPGESISIKYSVSTGQGENAAVAGEDFVGIAGGNLKFPAGTSPVSIPITVPILEDRKIELTESFVITIDSVEGALPGGSDRVVVNIIDNDGVGLDGNVPAADPLSSPFFSPITPTTQTVPFLTPEATNPPAIRTDFTDTILGNNDDELLSGGDGNDTIDGRGGNDTITGAPGQDVIFGGPGLDVLFGNAGEDVIYGGEGDDLIFGGKGNDTLFGNEGNDVLTGDLGNDFLFGGPGNDRFVLQANAGTDFVGDFVVGTDLLVLSGGIQFNQLAITQVGGNTVIRLDGKDLMILAGVTATAVTAASFVIG
ncbi:MAG: Calx-beta domain-containing protein [Pseudanabaenaceae cyanobacterium SKYGB_i_bin29]|nr:hypothetical protein [Pseudanabaenaceae cyanobacterium SKYG29]MDW8422561.1 Calx-beta domain-containing protein [Pseudanabaenaceae cyanobacterium SKYGB_i_bin29]